MKENKVLYYINMSIIILLLNLFFILLIFYQIFLTRNIFKKKIIEGLDLRNPNYNPDLDPDAVNALYNNSTIVTPAATPAATPTPSNEEIYNQVKTLADENRKNTTTIDILNQKVSALSDQVKGMLLSQETVLTKGIDTVAAAT
jgi:hypothetical protein